MKQMIRISSLVILFIIATVFITDTVLAQQGRSGDGERRFQSRTGIALDLDLTQHTGFYFIDELGVNLSLRNLVQEGFLDLETYKLGHGDLISLQLKGEVSGTFRGILISPQGDISLPNIGTVSLKDLTIPQAVDVLNEEVQSVFTDTDVTLILERPRLYRVHIIGDVPFPGLHYVTAQTRVDQAIYMSLFEIEPDDLEDGLPLIPFRYSSSFLQQSHLSLRNIEIHRDSTHLAADLYGYFRAGFKDSNPIVEDGDIIHIRERRQHSPGVTISGAIKRNLEIEYREEDSLEYLIQLAGGVTDDAHGEHVRVIRRSAEEVDEYLLSVDSEEFRTFNLQPNDRIVIPFDREKRENFSAWVHGEAVSPGNFPIRDGVTTLSELLELSGGLTDEALSHAAYLVRTRPADTQFGPRAAFNAQQFIRTSDQYRQGFEYLSMEEELNRNQIYLDLTDEEKLSTLALYHGDQLYIPRDDNTVFVMGQVNKPGYFPFNSQNSTSDYIALAGGFALSAEEERVFVIKASSNAWHRAGETDIQSGDVIFVDRTPFDDLQASRAYDIQQRQMRNSNIQLIMTGLTTITGIITTYVAITR